MVRVAVTEEEAEAIKTREEKDRARGRLAYLKPGKYGFVKPVDGKSKEDNAFFSASEIRDAVELGDWIEYTPFEALDKNGELKRQARDIRKCEPPKKPERPSRLRSTPSTPRERIAKGPDGTIGFNRKRSLNVAARDFIPSSGSLSLPDTEN